MLRHFVAVLIRGYQRFISPHKGFCCAHAAVHGGRSCSEAVRLLVLQRGMIGAWPLIKGRFAACHAAAQLMSEKQHPKSCRERLKQQCAPEILCRL